MSQKKDVSPHGDRCEGRRTVVNATLNHSQLFLRLSPGLARVEVLNGTKLKLLGIWQHEFQLFGFVLHVKGNLNVLEGKRLSFLDERNVQ